MIRNLSLSEIANICRGELLGDDISIERIETDTRKLSGEARPCLWPCAVNGLMPTIFGIRRPNAGAVALLVEAAATDLALPQGGCK